MARKPRADDGASAAAGAGQDKPDGSQMGGESGPTGGAGDGASNGGGEGDLTGGEGGARDGNGGDPELPPATVPSIWVRSVSPTGRRRAGIAFGPEPQRIPLDELSEERIEAIQSDPLLVWQGDD